MTLREMELIATICPAIQSNRLIRFWYENASGSKLKEWRTVEPYVIGAYPQRHIQLLAWLLPTHEQFMTGQQEAWRSYTLRNISELQLLETVFSPRRDFDPKGSGMKTILCSAQKELTHLRIV